MSAPLARRGFLRGLTTLPLVGGGVTLIGQPTAVASPVTRDLLVNYETWLAQELHQLIREKRPGGPYGHYQDLDTPAFAWHDAHLDVQRPSERAALVLATVGVDLRGGAR